MRRAVLVGAGLEGVGGLLREARFAVELVDRIELGAPPVEAVYVIVEPAPSVITWSAQRSPRPGLIGIAEHRERLLASGYDDAVSAPWYPRELAARVRAVHKRMGGVAPANERMHYDGFTLDLAGLTRDGVEIPLTAHERAVLRELMRANGRAVSREALRKLAWDSAVDARTVDTVVVRLRRKLPNLIETVRSVGYRLRLGT